MGEKADFRSFLSIILYILDKADPRENVNKLYVHDCNRVTSASTSCIMDDLYIHERNFFDEDNEPMTCKDVLSSLVEYLGMTLIQWKDAYYIVDYDYLQSDYANFFMYLRDTSNVKLLTLPLARLNVRDIGVASSNGSISLDNVYNKVSIVASTNAVGELCPELLSDEDLKNQNEDVNKYYSKTINETVFLFAYFKSKENWVVDEWNTDYEITDENVDEILPGSFFQKNCSYSTNEAEPSALDWNAYLTVKRTSIPLYWGELSGWIKNDPFLTLNKKENTLFVGGYLIIDLNYKLSQSNLADDGFVSSDAAYYDGQYSAGFTDTKFACLLKIGDYYYTGDEWRLYSEYLNNIDFYRECTYIVAIDGVNNYYILASDGSKIFISYEEYEKRNLEDKFWLVHKNKANDKIFDTWYSLTNQVSYKYNLSNASDGVLIKLPDFCLYGEMTFELCPHSTLGSTQSYRTDMPKDYTTCHYCHIKDLSVKYANTKYIYDVFGSELEDLEDIVYSNVINDNYITEAEDVELLVNSYSKGILSYSNVATKKDGKFDYLKSVYNRIAGGEYLPEQILIDKLYRHHKTPKFIYQNSLNYKFSPFDMIKENSLDKTMAINTLGVDYANDSVDVALIEL